MRLICFGDSWTAGHGIETDVKFAQFTGKGGGGEKLIQPLDPTQNWLYV